jgi:hypothetical protein
MTLPMCFFAHHDTCSTSVRSLKAVATHHLAPPRFATKEQSSKRHSAEVSRFGDLPRSRQRFLRKCHRRRELMTLLHVLRKVGCSKRRSLPRVLGSGNRLNCPKLEPACSRGKSKKDRFTMNRGLTPVRVLRPHRWMVSRVWKRTLGVR